jgi:putative hydrolase of the HAD superfamily
MARAVLFDLDNTLVDRDAAWARFFAARGLAGREREVALMRDRSGYEDRFELARWLAQRFPDRWPTPLDALHDALDAVPDLVEALAGAPELLVRLKGRVRVGVVTNGGAGQRRKAERAGLLELVEACVVSSEAGAEKPHPRPFLDALRALRVEPDETVFVGDNPDDDIQGARALGMKTVWLSHGRCWPAQLPAPDAIAQSVADVERAIEEVDAQRVSS